MPHTSEDHWYPEGLTLSTEPHGLQTDKDGWEHRAYTVTLGLDGRTMTLPYKMGTAFDRPPTIEDVVDSISLDAVMWENDDLDEVGPLSKTQWEQWKTQVEATKHLFGLLYERFLWGDHA